jgi:1,4-alpha-glucan branching enzyme
MPRGPKASVVIDKSSSDAANMKALSRTDSSVLRILHKVPHGAVYVFDVDAATWVSTLSSCCLDTSGCCPGERLAKAG